MRLKVILDSDQITLPLNYKNLLQGVIYSSFKNEEYGSFLHNTGYQSGPKPFKLFVLSDLLGTFHIHERQITYSGKLEFYIGSLSNGFLETLYQRWLSAGSLRLGTNRLEISAMAIEDLPWFPDTKEVTIRTLSPVTAYRSENGKFQYYSPEESEFQTLCLQNIQEKSQAYFNYCQVPVFSITDVKQARKRIVHFKNTFYIAYAAELKVLTNFETLQLIWSAGLSAKNPAGFGMIQVLS
ncbi:CRISPR-associated endoribonuclease Cas6 [Faecalibaculum rodentium]|uniref:CRISPR associated protein Cas6 C-terminal domain-containing protein n=1 Tax=Faecalibaculum rodentium TaxID=1702221 RepID=A0A140DRJ3_9FIRM|nr:CRISPR-associated endoribonuclease Cas6 [Faecalibaculum rodentium]AMK53270.1 hypothetical protein AALO17_01360 [Faecalibaculum rodentium]